MRTAQELNSLALRTRRWWNEDGYSPIDIFAIVNGWKDKNYNSEISTIITDKWYVYKRKG